MQGIPTFCTAGDDGAMDNNAWGSGLDVEYPASSPYAFGCGGTTLNDINTEVAWDESGGGISRVYKVPEWQARSTLYTLHSLPSALVCTVTCTHLAVSVEDCALSLVAEGRSVSWRAAPASIS